MISYAINQTLYRRIPVYSIHFKASSKNFTSLSTHMSTLRRIRGHCGTQIRIIDIPDRKNQHNACWLNICHQFLRSRYGIPSHTLSRIVLYWYIVWWFHINVFLELFKSLDSWVLALTQINPGGKKGGRKWPASSSFPRIIVNWTLFWPPTCPVWPDTPVHTSVEQSQLNIPLQPNALEYEKI